MFLGLLETSLDASWRRSLGTGLNTGTVERIGAPQTKSPAMLPLLCLHSCLMHLPCPSVVSSPPSRVFVRPHFVPVLFVPARLSPLLRCVHSFPLVSFSFVFPSSPFLVQAIEGTLIIGSTSCRLSHSLLNPLGCLLHASWDSRNSFVPNACTLPRFHALLLL